MCEEISNEESLTEQDYTIMLKKLKKKKAEKYKFTFNGGESYKAALFCLYKWSGNVTKNLYYGKYKLYNVVKRKRIENQRFIHSKEEIP